MLNPTYTLLKVWILPTLRVCKIHTFRKNFSVNVGLIDSSFKIKAACQPTPYENMFQRPLICTDFTDGLHRLTQFVPSLAAGGMQQIVFLHTLPISPEREIPRPNEAKVQEVRDRLATALTDIPSGVDVQIEVQTGKPIDHILQASKTHQTDLILMGMPNRSRLDNQLFGSTAIALCQKSRIPILTLRPQLLLTYTSEELELRCRHLLRSLLVPYDDSHSSNHLIQVIQSHVPQSNSQPNSQQVEKCVLCWVIEEGRRGLPQPDQLQKAQEKLTAVQTDLTQTGLQVDVELRQGAGVAQVLAVAAEKNVSAIATSSNRMGTLSEWALPSFTSEVLQRSWHPVLFFPG
jgi:nucleotide-binding universal stress UspA family protein